MCMHIADSGCSGGTVLKDPPVNAKDVGLIPGSGKSPGRGNGNPLQYSCLENPHGQKSLVGLQPMGSQSGTWLVTKQQGIYSFSGYGQQAAGPSSHALLSSQAPFSHCTSEITSRSGPMGFSRGEDKVGNYLGLTTQIIGWFQENLSKLIWTYW